MVSMWRWKIMKCSLSWDLSTDIVISETRIGIPTSGQPWQSSGLHRIAWRSKETMYLDIFWELRSVTRTRRLGITMDSVMLQLVTQRTVLFKLHTALETCPSGRRDESAHSYACTAHHFVYTPPGRARPHAEKFRDSQQRAALSWPPAQPPYLTDCNNLF